MNLPAEGSQDHVRDRIFIRGDLVPPAHTDPLWPGRANFGEIAVIDGPPGGGKSTLTMDLGARLTAERPQPDSELVHAAAGLLWIGSEDNSHTVAEMLRVAGAVMSKVTIYDKTAGTVLLPDSVASIESEVRRTGARLVVFDPLSAFLRSMTSEVAVRTALQPLAAMAERNRVAVFLIRHLTKTRGRNALYQGAGSVAIVGLARNGLLVGRESGNGGRRVAAQFKSNAGPLAPSLAFNIVEEGSARRIEWLGESEYTADQILGEETQELSALEEACALLHAILSDGPKWVSDCKRIATKSGITPSTLGRAKRRLKVKSRKKGFGKDSRMYWVLPPGADIARQLKERDIDQLFSQLVNGEEGPPDDDPSDSGPPRRPPGWGDDGADSWKQPT